MSEYKDFPFTICTKCAAFQIYGKDKEKLFNALKSLKNFHSDEEFSVFKVSSKALSGLSYLIIEDSEFCKGFQNHIQGIFDDLKDQDFIIIAKNWDFINPIRQEFASLIIKSIKKGLSFEDSKVKAIYDLKVKASLEVDNQLSGKSFSTI